MTRKEKLVKEPSPPQAQKDIDESITAKIEENKKYLFEKVDVHLEKPLKKENRDTAMHRHMTRHYYTRNMVCKIRVKNMKKKLKKTLEKLKKKDNIQFFSKSSLVVSCRTKRKIE